MAGAIKKTEIVEADLGQLSDDLHKVGESIAFIISESAKVKPITGLSDLAKITKETAENAKNLAIQQKAVLDIETKVVALIEKEAKAREAESKAAIKSAQEKTQAIINEEKAIQAKIKTDKDLLSLEKQQEQQKLRNAKAIKAEEGSYDQLNATLNQTIREYKALSQADRENAAIGGEMIKNIAAQDAQLKQLDATMGRNQRNVGNYKNGFNGLNFSVMQIGRELPSLAYGFNVFVGAISNNLPMVTDEIKRAKDELEALRIKGEKGIPIWKQLAGAIFSWQTAMVVGITVMTMYGREIGSFISKLFNGKDAIDEMRKAQESLNKIKAEGRGEAQSELTRLSLLWGALKDVNTSAETRNKIYKELQEKYPNYFKNIDDESMKIRNVEKGYYQLRDAIIATAQSRVYAETIAKNKSIIETDLKLKLDEATTAVSDYYNENKDLINRDTKLQQQVQGLGAANTHALIVKQRYDNLIKIQNDAKKEILKKEAENFRLMNMVDVEALTNDFGAAKLKEKKQKEKIGLTIGQLKKEFNEEDKLNEIRKKEVDQFFKDEQKRLKDNSSSQIEIVREQIDLEIMALQEASLEKVKLAKGNKDEIEKIQYELNQSIIKMEYDKLDTLAKSGEIIGKDYLNVLDRMRGLNITHNKNEINETTKTEEEKKQIRRETMQATSELLSQGLAFSQQIYAAQATRAQETYDAEMNAAGDSLEAQTLAKRKFEAEDKKIKQKQAIASKLQAVLDASLALALAIATTWKNPFLAALNIGAATLGLGMALATPIPQFAEGTDFAPSSFIAGEEGSELIKTKSGKMILTPNKATLFSDNNLIGSTVFPHDQTQRMLANMAFNQVREVVDMRETNSTLLDISKSVKRKDERFIDASGRLNVKRGNITTKY